MSKKLICLVSLVFVWGLTLANPARAELVAWWRLDEGSGTMASDSSGNGNDARFEGSPVWEDGKLGESLKFNGSSDYLAAPDSESLDINGDQLSIAAWVNGEAWPAANHVLRKIADTGTGSIYMIRVQSSGMVRTYLNTPAGDTIVDGTTALAVNGWIHIALVYDGAQSRIYVNGQLDAAMDVSGEITQSDNELRIGRGEPAGYFMGMIDDVRVYNHALTEDELLSAMEGGGSAYPSARSPNPKDGTILSGTWVSLNWSPGDFAVSHDVYLGNGFDDVNDGIGDTFMGNQAETSILAGFPGFAFPDGLVPGTTYYWRIDEVNDADPNSPWKGNVWSFSIPPKTAYWPDPADGAEFVDPNAIFTWAGGYGSKLHTVYLGDNYDDVNNAVGGMPLGSPSHDPGTLEPEKVLYWRVDEFDGAETYKGDVWSFTTPGAVGNPQPANGAVDVQMIETLSWAPADNATSHELYFGADADAVKKATTASPEYVGPRTLGAESYDPGGLAWDGSYAWRVDEVYPSGTVKGLVWTFTTADFILVDDFESYDDIDPLPGEPGINRIFDKWLDGFGTTTNGALVGNDLPPYAETTIVHGGAQSLVYRYDNNLKTSEATLTLVYPRDWTAEGVTKLSLWFRGGSTNSAERMFVALNPGTPGVVYHDDASATQIAGWNQWVIDLQEFVGVNLTNVNSITIGIGTKGSPAAGGAGQMYFDDIRLYR